MVNLLALLLACGQGIENTVVEPVADDPATSPDDDGSNDTPVAEPATTVHMDAMNLLIRASLDLRGVRPSLEEIEAVEADPSLVDSYIEQFLYDEDFGGRVRDLFAPIYLTRVDYFTVSGSAYGLTDTIGFAEAVGNEPLYILSRIVTEDLPYTDIVTGDWTMANELLAAAWELDYPEDGSGWQVSYYQDERPSAGIISTNGLWWRYITTYSNANRGRANALSKILLCTDYLTKPISFDRNVNLLDGDAVNDALKNNSGCAACHSSLDPLASYLWGFYYYDYYAKADMSVYHAEREHMYETVTEVNPGYYGTPGYTLNDLGDQIAGDSRLPECITQQVFEVLVGRDVELEDFSTLSDNREAFLDDGLQVRTLFRQVLAGDDYRAGDESTGLPLSRKMVTPELLASQVQDLTGYRFTYYGYDMLTTDTYGVRTLAGGVDGNYVTSPAEEPMATMSLVVERLTQGAADYAVQADKARPDSARLFTEVHFVETPDTDRDAMVAQIQRLHLRLFGKRVEADGQEVEANLDLWQDLYDSTGDIEASWAGVLSVLMRDPDFLLY